MDFDVDCPSPLTPGYIIYYSTDANAEVHDWVVEPVMGNRLTHQIQELTLDTTYYFKIQARNSKGMGPLSETVHFRTPKGMTGPTGESFKRDNTFFGNATTVVRNKNDLCKGLRMWYMVFVIITCFSSSVRLLCVSYS